MVPVMKRQTTLGSMENMNELQRWIRLSVLALVVVSVLGTGFVASTSTDLSPATAAAQTDSQSQNQTGPTVELDSTNNTTTKTIVVSKASLPEGGFVAIHGGGYTRGVFHGSEIAISQYLTPGTHRNIAIPVNRSIPGGNNVSKLNATRANLSQLYTEIPTTTNGSISPHRLARPMSIMSRTKVSRYRIPSSSRSRRTPRSRANARRLTQHPSSSLISSYSRPTDR